MSLYFRNVPNFDYVDRTPENRSISEYITVKNLFKRSKIRDDIFSDLTYFTKYFINGDDRPDNIAYKFYEDETLDWLVLLANNITNVQTEWPKSEEKFNSFLFEKYGSANTIFSTRHYESREVKNLNGDIIFKKGIIVPKNFKLTYYEERNSVNVTVSDVAQPITNFTYEDRLEEKKRGIYLLKQKYVPIVVQDLEREMPYKEGSTQYVSETLKRAENIRLFE